MIDFKEKASYLLTELKDKFSAPKSTSLISPEQITRAIEIALKKVPIFTETKLIPRITTFTFPYQYKNFHSFITPFTRDRRDRFQYHLFAFHMMDHSMNPVYSFLFQLGNILAFDLTHHITQIPSEFYQILEKENIDRENLTEEDAHTFFCDAFAASMLYHTEEENLIAYPFPKSFMETFLPYFENLSFKELKLQFETVYDSLLNEVQKNGLLPISKLTESLAKQLFVLEKKTPYFLTFIFDATQAQIESLRKKVIGRVYKDYVDEKILWKGIYYTIPDNILKLSVSLLEELKKLGYKEIYCANENTPKQYQTLFIIEEELERQKEIAAYNLENPRNKKESLIEALLKRIQNCFQQGTDNISSFLSDEEVSAYQLNQKTEEFLCLITQLLERDKTFKTDSISFWDSSDKKTAIVKEQPLENVPFQMKGNHKARKKMEKRKGRKIDQQRAFESKLASGNLGQELVLMYEKEKLKDYPELVKEIIPYYLIDDDKGFDIESYHTNGDVMYIEVKTSSTSKNSKRVSFMISAHEDEFIMSHPNSFIYYVYDVDNPKLKIMTQNDYMLMTKESRNFRIDVDCN